MVELYPPLSPRELEVVPLVAADLTNREIARKLGISHQTVKNHISNILRKLGLNNRAELMVVAFEWGWAKQADAYRAIEKRAARVRMLNRYLW